jgi:outer membrane lipoprotein carrier protein
MKKIFYLNLLVLLCFASVIAQNSGNELLKRVQDKYKSISSFSTDFTQYYANGKKISGKFYYKKNNNIRFETKNSTIVSNGSINWNYIKNQNKVIISKYDDSDVSMFSFNKIISGFSAKSNVQTTEKGSNVLVIIPKEDSDLNFNQVKLWINDNDLVKKIEIKEMNNSVLNIELSDYKLNQNLSDSQFSFTPPEGSKVIDLR